MQKARRHNAQGVTPTACKRMVSGSFHSLSQGSFHLSLTVLVRYRSLRSIQPWQMVLPSSNRVSPAPSYSFNTYKTFVYGTFTLFGRLFQNRSTYFIGTLGLIRFRSPLLAESLLFSFPPGTQMFQFPGFSSCDIPITRDRFPHSDIHGSKIICISPRLFAAYHVLRRL